MTVFQIENVHTMARTQRRPRTTRPGMWMLPLERKQKRAIRPFVKKIPTTGDIIKHGLEPWLPVGEKEEKKKKEKKAVAWRWDSSKTKIQRIGCRHFFFNT